MLRRIGRVLFKHIPLWTWRVFSYAVFGASLLVGGSILALRYWLLPNIGTYHAQIERALGDATGHRVLIGTLEGDWVGLRPHLALRDVRILNAAGEPAIALDRVENTLSWLSLLHWEPRFHAIRIHQPHLSVRRDAAGTVSIAGIAMNDSAPSGGLSDWILRQREIVVRDARIDWTDEKLAAPELNLTGVTLRLYNEGDQHRFGLRAEPPAAVAKPLDVRGDLNGRTVRDLARWEGTFFVQVDYVDLAAWRKWIPLPIELPQGYGAVRMWVDVAGEQVKQVTADLRLAEVRTRLAADLPELDLAALAGRISWRSWSQGFELSTRQLTLTTQGGTALQPVDFHLRRLHGDGTKPARGELSANALDLEPLATFADHLPLDGSLREELRRFDPRGSVYDLAVKWTGGWPVDTYQARARFEKLGIEAQGLIPGFKNAHGTLEASETKGTLTLADKRVVASLPRVFTEPLVFEQLAAQVTWTHGGGAYDVRLANVSFANGDVAGTLQGAYQSVPGGSGVIDLTGVLTRADARHLARYLPLVVGSNTREWLASAIRAGQSNDVRLRLKGDLAKFPFVDGRDGIFQVTARATGGVVEYAQGWPRIEGAAVDLAFTGARMEIRASQAGILGARLARVRAAIADMRPASPLLEISGEAEGPTSEFLRYIAESPVNAMTGRFTEGMQAQGRGRLALNLEIPLGDRPSSRVSGNYQFVGNQLLVDPGTPPLEQVNGRLEFSESSVRLVGITTAMFGGQATISGATQADGSVRISAQGRANIDALRKSTPDTPLIQHFTGAADWQGTLTLRNKLAEFVVESGMQGVGTDLPPPFAKAPGDTVPLRLERRLSGPQQDSIQLAWGSNVSAHFVRRAEGRGMVVERGAVGLGTPAPSPERPGLWVAGTLPTLDLDQWRAVFAAGARADTGSFPAVASLDLRFGSVDLFGRRFHDVGLKGREQSGRWVASLVSREANGEVSWRGQGRGQLVLRMKNLTIPAPLARAVPLAGPSTPEQPNDYPGLDAVVEDFRHKDRALGRLEVLAVPDGRGLRIERLRLASPDAVLAADGAWQWSTREPRTHMNIRLDVSDIGRYFARMGYPEGIRGGTARLEGPVSWAGAPQEIDIPTLSGTLMLEATKGQFLKLDPGIGKLLSILSLQALPRRIALDFKDVFSEGFTFDEIIGALKIQRGVASADTLRINGSSAKIAMSGDVDLTRETQKLKVRVIPSVGDSVSTVTTLLGGPVAGIGMFLAQRLLNDPFGQLAAHEYLVTGTWTDPQVSKFASPDATRAEPPR